jgi:hypothetical protein
MDIIETFKASREALNAISKLTEAKGHLDHPEDLVFLDGSSGATQAVNAIVATAQNPQKVTIKWDGYPALIFGRGTNGKFTIMDKHMFNKKDGTGRVIYSPEQFIQYDKARGVDRTQLHAIISNIWEGLAKSMTGKGYYWGDLLFSQPLKEQNGLYRFRANPNGITYTVDADSDMGKFLAGKNAGIVVHQYIPVNAESTDESQPLDGTIGTLKNASDVAIVPAKMPITPKITLDKTLVQSAKNAITKYGAAVDKLMSTAPQAASAFQQLFTTYINKKIVAGDLNDLVLDFLEYIETRPMTDSMREKLSQHIKANEDGVVGAFTIWAEIYKLKMNIVEQLNKAAESSSVKGYLQSGTQTQEGFVSQGLKFVDRMGFSRQNLAGR